jgi:hypothetical protein
VRPDAAVVRDHDEVVELDALLDHGVLERPAIDGGVRADLDVVAHLDTADLRHLDPGALVRRKSETIRSDHRPRLHYAAPANPDTGTDMHPCHELRVVGDRCAAFDETTGPDEATSADKCASTNYHMRADLGTGVDAGIRRDHGAWMSAGPQWRIGVQ